MADKTYRNATVAVSLFSLILLVSTTAHAATTADVPNANSIVKDNIEYYMQTDKAVYDVRENVQMLYRVTNVGNEDVEFSIIRYLNEPSCIFEVIQDVSRIWTNLPSLVVFVSVDDSFNLKPNENKEFSEIWNMYDDSNNLINSGQYDIVSYLHLPPTDDRYVPVSVSIDIIHEPKTYYINPGESIQARIDDPNVIDGDTIIVYPGTYTGDGNRDIDFLGKAITVRSIDPNDPNIVSATIIDCDGTKEEPHRGFYFHNDEDENSILAGFTITNGYAYTGGGICCQACGPTITNCVITLNTGGGIHCGSICYLEDPGGGPIEPPPGPPIAPPILPPATVGEEPPEVLSDSNLPGPTITNCTFTENTGGGVGIGYSNATLVNCIFSGNSGTGVRIGGSNVTLLDCFFNENSPGVYIRGGNTTLVNCTFHDNFSWEKGGAIYSYDSNTTLTNCIFTDNSTNYWGGAIYSEYQSSLTLTGCTFIANSSGMGGGGIYNIDDSSATLTNCTFSGNSANCGGGIYNKESSLKLTGCKFNNNFNLAGIEGGGGIYSECGKPTITNCSFTGNSARSAGGGIFLCRCYVPPILPPSPSSILVPFSSLDEPSSLEILSDSNTPGPLIANCIFTGNSASSGGGLATYEPNSTVVNCIFIENTASSGGGMASSATNTSLTKCIFLKNSANNGGGLSSSGNLTSLNHCIFSNNSAQYWGGAIRNEGIEYLSNSYMVMANSSFTGNSANYGGGIYNKWVLDAIILNCAFTGNRAIEYGGAIYNFESTTWFINSTCSQNWAALEGGGIWWLHLHPSSESPPGPQPPPIPALPPVPDGSISNSTIEEILATDVSDVSYMLDPMITNCIFWGNKDGTGQDISAQMWVDLDDEPFFISYNCIEGWPASSSSPGSMNANPAFVQLGYWADPNDPNIAVEPNDPLAIWINGDYHLLPISVCIDAGDPCCIPDPNDTDLDGNPRIIGGLIDIGAYEYPGPRQTRLFYVDDDAVGESNGSSWEDAFNYLQDALTIAGRGDEIRVAQGIYKPDQGDGITSGDREAVFRLRNGVAIRGGYAGIGEHDPNERNVNKYTSILSGDLLGNDPQLSDADELIYDPYRAENSYHVLNTSETDDTTVLDGLTITAGYDNRYYQDLWPGPGLTPIGQGGGMFNYRGNPMLTNCTFSNNSANLEGGAIYNLQSTSSLANCIFNRNFAAEHGGGIYNSNCSTTLAGCMFIKNCSGESGALCNRYESIVRLSNCTFVGNFARNGTPPFIWQDFELDSDADQISSSISNSILWDEVNYLSSLTPITYSDVRGGWSGQGNINAAPCFVDEANDDYHLLPSSPCIDAGDPNYIAEPNETDLDGKLRVINGRIDMGAYEYIPPIPAEVDIDPNTLNLNSKGKWITAFIWLPEEYNVADIDPNSILLDGEIKPDRFLLSEDNQVAIAKFSREEVQSILDIGEVELTISLRLMDETIFEGTDTVKVMDKGSRKSSK